MSLSSEIIVLKKIINKLDLDYLDTQVDFIANLIFSSSKNGRITVIFGNGGSAADANHWAGELTCIFSNKERKPLNVISLTSNMPVITAWANDFDFESVFSRQIEATGHNLAVAIGLSTSGRSKNVLQGLKTAKRSGAHSILITGSNPPDLAIELVDTLVSIPSSNTAFVQTITQLVYHSICQRIDEIALSTDGKQHPPRGS